MLSSLTLLVVASHNPASFSDHRHCSNGETMGLIYHVIWEEHVAKGSRDSIGGSPPW